MHIKNIFKYLGVFVSMFMLIGAILLAWTYTGTNKSLIEDVWKIYKIFFFGGLFIFAYEAKNIRGQLPPGFVMPLLLDEKTSALITSISSSSGYDKKENKWLTIVVVTVAKAYGGKTFRFRYYFRGMLGFSHPDMATFELVYDEKRGTFKGRLRFSNFDQTVDSEPA